VFGDEFPGFGYGAGYVDELRAHVDVCFFGCCHGLRFLLPAE
jgi:hypothetical protein